MSNASVTSACVLMLTPSIVGCHKEMPFELVPISGRVTYDDGSRIDAGSLVVTFNPVNAPTEGGVTPPGALAQVNVQDGAFSDVMTRRPGDGVLVGRHKVVVLSYKPRADGRPVPSKAVPEKYRKVDTTPLEVEISKPNQFVEIKVAKP